MSEFSCVEYLIFSMRPNFCKRFVWFIFLIFISFGQFEEVGSDDDYMHSSNEII